MLDISFALPALPKSGALVLLAEDGGEPDAIRLAADEATAGGVSRALEAAEFKPRPGKTCTILAPGAGLSRIVVAGIGKLAELTPRTAEEAGGAIAAALARRVGGQPRRFRADPGAGRRPRRRSRLAELPVRPLPHHREARGPPEIRQARGAGGRPGPRGRGLGGDARRGRGRPPRPRPGQRTAERADPARNGRALRGLEKLGLKVEVLGPREWPSSVSARCSACPRQRQEPRMVIMHWLGATGAGAASGTAKTRKPRAARPLAFVGKGVTFDTGGISIKPAQGMEDMKWDMAGAGAVVGLMAALAGRNARVDAVGWSGWWRICRRHRAAAGRRGQDLFRPDRRGDQHRRRRPPRAGRRALVLRRRNSSPRFIVDLATLTGAMVIALGHEYAGFFSNDDELARPAARRRRGERRKGLAHAAGRRPTTSRSSPTSPT